MHALASIKFQMVIFFCSSRSRTGSEGGAGSGTVGGPWSWEIQDHIGN